MRNYDDCRRKCAPLIAFYSQLQPSLFQQKILRTVGSLTAPFEACTVFEGLIEFVWFGVHSDGGFDAGLDALHIAGVGIRSAEFRVWDCFVYHDGAYKGSQE